MKFSAEALAQIAELRRHYHRKHRPEAARNLTAALRQAIRQIKAGQGTPAPRAYPDLAAPGEAWTYAGRYWIVYTATAPPIILAVFYDTANIPTRWQGMRG